jgi:hypothetical protein
LEEPIGAQTIEEDASDLAYQQQFGKQYCLSFCSSRLSVSDLTQSSAQGGRGGEQHSMLGSDSFQRHGDG